MLDPEVFDAIGRLITSWKTVEFYCVLGSSWLLKSDYHRTRIAMSSMQASTMLSVLRSLVHYDDADRREEFDRLYSRLDRARAYRNEAAHADIIGLHGYDPMRVVNRKVRVQKRGVVLHTETPISAHAIYRRALFTKIAAGTLAAFLEPYRPPLELPTAAGKPSP